jgi:hypothetical protein
MTVSTGRPPRPPVEDRSGAVRAGRVVLALDGRGHLELLSCGIALARRECVPLEIIAGRMRLAPFIHFAPVDVRRLRNEIAEEADALLLRAIARIPPDVAVNGRLVDGKAWPEIERIAAGETGAVLAVRWIGPRGLGRWLRPEAGRTGIFRL